MSAGPDAKPLGPMKDGTVWELSCDCGFKGWSDELLVEDDNEMMYCPQCRTIGWVWGYRMGDLKDGEVVNPRPFPNK